MGLNELKYTPGSVTKAYRKGRGVGSGNGKTCGKGHKGQRSRSGHMKVGFEGGQNPLYRRLPKFGFSNMNRKEYACVNLEQLNRYKDGTNVNPTLLKSDGVIKCECSGVKILGQGTLEKKLNIEAHKFSKSAKAKIEKAGGSIKEIK
ncbi:MAG: 50S ribosomal protein L15 [Bacilli bacterium]|nr:50S ribosomal protein L15 [Bacilli bacterium]